ncbi:MAG: glycoside hydrolase family 3 C-terminal domain-containing protein [Anaerolineae bacterium]|nr:glycoside hydrolase family 3 C-terminal domain-containing protein [Anaerolineae bacterium]
MSNRTESVDQRVEELLGKMTLKEKVSLLSGLDFWHTVPIERLGIPSLVMTDGPHGVRASEAGRPQGPTTAFPTGVSMAASWNPELIERVGVALAEETRAMGCDILLGPCVNIIRTPLAGRNFETYSEDPYLAGRIGVAWVRGLQSRGVGASLKHYACNEQETERFRGSSEVDERTLREIYLSVFETIVKEAQPWTVMCSYNRINGIYASQHRYLLTEILRKEWGFEGVVVSDWGANHTTVESVTAGLDIEMPGPAKYYGPLLVEAVRNWQVDKEVVDNAVRRILRMIIRSGRMDGVALPEGSVNTPEHQSLARELAEESITLLKNERGILPLDAGKLTSLAVIGPNAAVSYIAGGGSSYVEPPYGVSPLEALRARLSDTAKIGYEQGCDNYVELPPLKGEYLVPARGEGQGLWGQYFTNPELAGEPAVERLDRNLAFWWLRPPEPVAPERFSVRWSGQVKAPGAGRYELQLVSSGFARLYLDGKLLLDVVPDPFSRSDWPVSTASAFVEFAAGETRDIVVEYIKPASVDFSQLYLLCGYAPRPEEDDRIERAAELARNSDVAIVFGGMPTGYESEGRDRPHMNLPGRQDELIRAVARANPNTVVVLNCGAPVSMPWLDEVPALILAYYPGQEWGNALANILLGAVNPSGKLSFTIPRRYQDNPTFINYPGAREVRYGEGIFVGYRYYDAKEIEPLFPFGFGLSYTTFEYSDLRVPEQARIGEPVEVTVTVRNTGDRAGKEVVQLYVGDRVASLPRPPRELKGFAKVALQPGESRTVHFTLERRAFAFYDPWRREWVVEPGEFEILVGASSRDIRARAVLGLV